MELVGPSTLNLYSALPTTTLKSFAAHVDLTELALSRWNWPTVLFISIRVKVTSLMRQFVRQ
jgi:hypothetical protein